MLLRLSFIIVSLFAIICVQASVNPDTVIVIPAKEGESLSATWCDALISRLPVHKIDSLKSINRSLTDHESAWGNLIKSKSLLWESFRDSLAVPFRDTKLNETIYIMTGFLWVDDAFTYKSNTVCFDLTALYNNYGAASLPINTERIDRLFAHEYTHLLHKAWLRQNKVKIKTFRDSILWECLYEGIGMYRSLTSKWMPVKDSFPTITQQALSKLYPIFLLRMKEINSKKRLSVEEKLRINKNLSRGPVNEKWGAFTVAIWLALEAQGDPTKLQQWIDKGPEAVLALAKKWGESHGRQSTVQR